MNPETVLNDFRNSGAWDVRYDLPLVPFANNPWLYGAYTLKILKSHGVDVSELVSRFEDHAVKCSAGLPGLYHRWPGGWGGLTSHDELMGMAYISPTLAELVLNYLEITDGEYNNTLEKVTYPPERHNVFRMVWLKPYLRACCKGRRVGMISQGIFFSHLVSDLVKYKGGDEGGRLRIWIMLEAMEKHPLSGLGVLLWREKMKSLGLSPKVMHEKYLAEIPIFHKYAALRF